MAHSVTSPIPYHLRAPRLRWAALAIDLSKDEVTSFRLVATDPSQPLKVRSKARLLLGLHQRIAIQDLCADLHMDRRTLFRIASDLKDVRCRKEFLKAIDAA